MRWQDAYVVNNIVEVHMFYANERRWERGTVIRKTRSGFPVVNVGEGLSARAFVADRKSDIRTPTVLPESARAEIGERP